MERGVRKLFRGGEGGSSQRPSYRVEEQAGDDDDEDVEESPMNDNEDDDDDESEAVSQQQPPDTEAIAHSAGSQRLSRILRSSAAPKGSRKASSSAQSQNSQNQYSQQQSLLSRVSIHQLDQVADFCGRVILPPLAVHPSSIGGNLLEAYPLNMQQEILLCQNAGFEFLFMENSTATGTSNNAGNTAKAAAATTAGEPIAMECLQYPSQWTAHKRSLGLYMNTTTANMAGYETMGGEAPLAHWGGGKHRQKVKFIVVGRSTNRPLLPRQGGNNNNNNPAANAHSPYSHANNNKNNNESRADDEKSDYDDMFQESAVNLTTNTTGGNLDTPQKNPTDDSADIDGAPSTLSGATNASVVTQTPLLNNNNNSTTGPQEEVSSFPVLLCITLNADGTAPDIRKLVPLDQLTTVQDLSSTVVQLAFAGDTIRIAFGPLATQMTQTHNASDLDGAANREWTEEQMIQATLDKERFIWSLLQIHAMLCTSVVEQHALTTANSAAAVRTSDLRYTLPNLSVRNLDRAELQYIATVNKFLQREAALAALLDRYAQAQAVAQRAARDNDDFDDDPEAKQNDHDDDEYNNMQSPNNDLLLAQRDTLAYNLLMGNYSSRVKLFHSAGEQKDAEEVLNGLDLGVEYPEMVDPGANANNNNNSSSMTTHHLHLGELLQQRMANLEAETCRRLIAWEDEKTKTASETMAHLHGEDQTDTTVDALALASLFTTLESLDTELADMEAWLRDMANAIKPLTDDCADIEEENRQLEQQWKSYDLLGTEMRRLLQGLDLDPERETILQNPASALVYLPASTDAGKSPMVDIDASEQGVEQIYLAGKALQEAIEYPKRAGGLHLAAVNERTQGLTAIAKQFCTALAQIIVTVMEQFKEEVVAGSDHGKVSKNDTHSMIAKKIRDTQRKFQSSLLAYIKLIEILAALSPEMLPALRDAYAELVSEGILMKKRCKGYFQALPGRNLAYLNRAGRDLRDYMPADESPKPTVNAPDIRASLNELLPVIAREAYFVSALFGEATKEVDGREKKRNFENARNAVDSSSHHFRYYAYRTCGIYSDEDVSQQSAAEAAGNRGDPLLCLVASIYLNEAMNNYIDREKKGGDHSLSLAYIRATILDLRKRADKQWVVWVDKQIDWIRSNEGVPTNGKRAGIFPSFQRFPCYLDHLLQCCREGRDEGYEPDISSIKVINYYLQKVAATLIESLREAAARDTTDQQYGSSVMLMENTYFFTHVLKGRGEMIANLFAKQITKANSICKDSTDAYLGWMIKREFVSLHELFSRVAKARKDFGDRELMTHVPKAQFVRTLEKEADRVVLREKIGAMFSRMEKHLSDDGGLLPVAWKALVKVLYEWFGRWEKLSSQLYGHRLDPSAVDVVRIAKAAGGAAKPNTKDRDSEFGFKSIMALKDSSGGQQVDV